jgi:Arc/MetJ-type ribon-helix-helix transcriptional regulator
LEGEAFGNKITGFQHKLSPKCFTPTDIKRLEIIYRGNFMIQIILNSEQEKLLQQLLETGKYTTPDRVITDALKALSEKQHLNQPRQVVTILSGKPAQELLAEKIKISRELKNSYQPEPHRQALAEDFNNLCEETQALHADSPLTDEEIAE